MIITTTNNVPGYETMEYKGLVTGEVINGINFVKDIGAGLRNVFGGRSEGYEEELIRSREEALAEMKANAEKIGANAVIGLKLDFESLGANGTMLLVTATGTAVRV